MDKHEIVSREEWLEQRKELLQREKQFTRQRDELTKARQALPWLKVEKEYVFRDVEREVKLSDLFDGRSQLIVYHFMFEPDWIEGCKICSFFADHYDRSIVHLNHRDVSMVSISRAPIDRLTAFKKRMGWSFQWVSSLDSSFNFDFNVSFTKEEFDQKKISYNYQTMPFFPSTEGPGLSVFAKDEDGNIFHTYSCFARGLDILVGAYNLLDLVPKGRDEDGFVYGTQWVRHHDKYGDQSVEDHYAVAFANFQQKP